MKTKEAQELQNALNSSEKAESGWNHVVLDRPQGGLRIIATKGNLMRLTNTQGEVTEVEQLQLPTPPEDRA